jgi:His-Xaa-Ser system radical SAM maturase HxsB
MNPTTFEITSVRPGAGAITLALPEQRWSERHILAAAHTLVGRAWVALARGEGTVIVELRQRGGSRGARGSGGSGSSASSSGSTSSSGSSGAGDEGALHQLACDLEHALKDLERREAAPVAFRRRDIGPETLVTNDVGDWALLTSPDFDRFAAGAIGPDEPLHAALAERRLVPGALDEAGLARARAERYPFIGRGPHLHVVVVTLRCDHSCRYCHASRVPVSKTGYDMDPATAERVVDTILASPNPWVTIEFQGGEPLANFGTVKHIIEYAEERNRDIGKTIGFALVTNLSLMDEAKLEFLLAHRVEICTSLDGPRELHNANRRFTVGDSWVRAVEWIGRINKRYEEQGLDTRLYRVEAILTVTRPALKQWREIVDTYVEVGCHSIFLRALNPFGFASATSKKIGYPMHDWLAFYEHALDYVIDLNRQGTDILERNAAIFLTKVLCGVDPNYLDIRSPCGAATGQLAYNYDGSVYTCDEGRMVSEMGDELFRMGHVGEDSYRKLMGADVVRAMVAASTLDGQPGCVDCAYKPYCGVCPVHNYAEMGSLHGRMHESIWCAKHMGMLDILFERLRRGRDDHQMMDILSRWTTVRPREHFMHRPEGPSGP